ncbi:NUDIX domain-containing protein [Rhodospirillum rubrum]|uniref:ADP-ribose pyrophosphatase n=1 Tax=Rhodospirillum rubrum (strain ATCC 11170 / ATH 1.1.1 / DSM 467 / LMG 4362 / NCIMB 8255 / S1) TaxID=269796 RepID=Q2RU70_RHORT|nr:NUDIX domain-containing protein [Rhodospirillum rubrum]ABC22325.1 Nucleoside diphosphate pyrophosphatase [Rhodospirillum rubrum ATCC 11170]AEO48041.1 nucleoside diphosphate pyrophosphatase [Rhodospirillum rubrum F11]MBK5953905.1 ADP-ribose diphosphatase [Rhodospirillum rubrum]QXG81965.1 NUDIX domain-containing protein [Rhodospirillum rubrum]HCF16852.1 NUDIX domain-containing protein [Rhodospirillum rubrum]
MRPTKVSVIERTAAFRGYFHVDRVRLRHELYSGATGPEIVREVFERGHAAAVLLYDADADVVVLIEQFRPGPWAAGEEPWMLEIVAGIIDAGETVEAVARRECQEECGLIPDELVPITRVFVSPGVMTETVALYCGRVDSRAAGGVHGLAEEGEDIRVVPMAAEAFIDLAQSGALTNATAALAGYWFALNRASLRARWRTGDVSPGSSAA